jgi:hypothetical protein
MRSHFDENASSSGRRPRYMKIWSLLHVIHRFQSVRLGGIVRSLAVWFLRIHGADVPGGWVIVDVRFVVFR